jgi:hypothetical protein
MKDAAAVALGKKRGAQLKKQLGKTALKEHMRALAYRRHRKPDKVAA